MIDFKPFNTKTLSIAKTLKRVSKEKNSSIKSIDFSLEAYDTFVRRKNVEEDKLIEDPSEIQTLLTDPNARLYQKYEIKLFPSDLDTAPYQLALSYNSDKTVVVATFKKGSLFVADAKLYEKLKTLIWHKKLLNGFLIGVFEEKMEQQLKKLLTMLPYGKKLPKDVKFNVASSQSPTPTTDAKIEEIYLTYNDDEHNYIDGVKEGDLILRYIKPKEGLGGRNCEGKYIPPRKPKLYSIPKHDESIRREEDDQYIEFYALQNGYVEYLNNQLKISKTLKLDQANFKATGNLDAKDLNEEVSVDISHKKGHTEDAIGTGVAINVKELNVDGSIAANVKVQTSELKVDAQTHKKSTLEVQNTANVKLHRGDLIANDAEVDILENGKVKAHQSIRIKKMLGGEAIAPRVYVEELISNATIVASELIEIKSMSGSHNTLIIKPDAIEQYHKALQECRDTLREKEHLYTVAQQELKDLLAAHKEQLPRIQTFQKRVKQAIAQEKKPMKQDEIRIKEYKRKTQKLSEMQKALHNKQDEIERLKEELSKLQEQDLAGHIKTSSLFDGHTKVVFVNPETKEQITALPEGRVDDIYLIKDENEQRAIKL